jgi:hypothetical protein
MVQAEGVANPLYRVGLSVNCNAVFLAEVSAPAFDIAELNRHQS